MPMRQLRNCDFCDGDAAGVYEAIPAELSPTEAEQRRVVLCSDCLETLETVVDPLLSRLGVDRDGAPESAAGSAEGAEQTQPADSVSTAETPTTADPTSEEPSEPTSSTSADAAQTAGSSSESAASPSDSPSRSSSPSRFGAPEGYTDIAEYDGFEEPEEFADPKAESEQNGVRDARPDRVEDPGRDNTAPESVSTRDPSPNAGRDAVGAEPDEFRSVMRLLGNREFPVERSAVVELAGSAYQLEDDHVDRILDHAVDRGVLTDDGGTLRKP